jgi:hypothetical protein
MKLAEIGNTTGSLSESSMLFVLAWQAAQQARVLHDKAIAIGGRGPLVIRLAAHATELEDLRDRIHDMQLTDADLEAGALPRRAGPWPSVQSGNSR